MLERLEAMKQAMKQAKKKARRVVPLRRVVPRRDPRVSSAAAVASRRVMARAALRELLDSIYVFWESNESSSTKAHAQGEGQHHRQSLPRFAEGLSG